MSRTDGRCNRDGCHAPGASRYSFGVYAGFLCVAHAREGFRDKCGLGPDGKQGDPAELDEPLDPP